MKEAMKQTYKELKRAVKEVGLSFKWGGDTIQVQHTYWKGSEDKRHD